MEFTLLIRIFVGIMLTKESSAVTFNSSVIMGQEIDALKANMRVISGNSIFFVKQFLSGSLHSVLGTSVM